MMFYFSFIFGNVGAKFFKNVSRIPIRKADESLVKMTLPNAFSQSSDSGKC